MFNDDSLAGHERMLAKLMKKRQKAFLRGSTNRVISLDRRIAAVELEIDDLMTTAPLVK